MTTGAAHGAGIYLSTAASVSIGYSAKHSPDASFFLRHRRHRRRRFRRLPKFSVRQPRRALSSSSSGPHLGVATVAPAKTLRQKQEETLRDKVRRARQEYKEAVIVAKQKACRRCRRPESPSTTRGKHQPPPPPPLPRLRAVATVVAATAAETRATIAFFRRRIRCRSSPSAKSRRCRP